MLSKRHFSEALAAGMLVVGCGAGGMAPDPEPVLDRAGSPVTFCTSCEPVGTRADADDIRKWGFAVDAYSAGTGVAYFRNAEASYDFQSGRFATDRCWPAGGRLDFVARFPSGVRTVMMPDGLAVCALPEDGDVLAARETDCKEGVCPLAFEHCFARIDGLRVCFGSSFSGLLEMNAFSLDVSVGDASGYWKVPFDAAVAPDWVCGRVEGCHQGAVTDLGSLSGKALGDIIMADRASLTRDGGLCVLSGLGLFVAPSDGTVVSVELMIGDAGDPDKYFLVRGSKPLDLHHGTAYDLVLEFPSIGKTDFDCTAVVTGWRDGGEYDIIY